MTTTTIHPTLKRTLFKDIREELREAEYSIIEPPIVRTRVVEPRAYVPRNCGEASCSHCSLSPVAVPVQESHESVLAQAYGQCMANQDQAACALVLVYLERQCSAGHFSTANALLQDTDVYQLSASVLVAILSITWHRKEQLESRNVFVRRAEQKLIADLGEDRALKLLENRR